MFGAIATKGRLHVECPAAVAEDDEDAVDAVETLEDSYMPVSPVDGKLWCLVRLRIWSCCRCISERPERELKICEIRWVGLSSAISMAGSVGNCVRHCWKMKERFILDLKAITIIYYSHSRRINKTKKLNTRIRSKSGKATVSI